MFHSPESNSLKLFQGIQDVEFVNFKIFSAFFTMLALYQSWVKLLTALAPFKVMVPNYASTHRVLHCHVPYSHKKEKSQVYLRMPLIKQQKLPINLGSCVHIFLIFLM